MPALWIIETFDVIDTSALASSRVGCNFRAVRSVLSDEKKLSIAALSQALPDRLIEQTMLWSAIELWAKGDGMKG